MNSVVVLSRCASGIDWLEEEKRFRRFDVAFLKRAPRREKTRVDRDDEVSSLAALKRISIATLSMIESQTPIEDDAKSNLVSIFARERFRRPYARLRLFRVTVKTFFSRNRRRISSKVTRWHKSDFFSLRTIVCPSKEQKKSSSSLSLFRYAFCLGQTTCYESFDLLCQSNDRPTKDH